MEEQARRVRAHSDNTGRPYFSIDYTLSLAQSGDAAMGGGYMEIIEHDNGEETPELYSPMLAPPSSSTAQRRNSEFTSTDKVKLHTSADLLFSQKAPPGTPSSQHRKKAHQFTPREDPVCEATLSLPVRRVKSATSMQDLELNRSAPPVSPFQASNRGVGDQNMLPGFVTCLNSRNVGKYKVGQRYRDGVVVGIDDDHGKIIVYNENLPRGALTVLRTQNADRYDRGFVLEDVRGGWLGTVHALDRIQNLLVLNTSLGVDLPPHNDLPALPVNVLPV
ncbi:hypothetical protein BASA81_001032 [Batrachochytrium salamandrivorans]|nr:hypothetical protein BASA81_001032 [Batrachochytrium salamandrivorans]